MSPNPKNLIRIMPAEGWMIDKNTRGFAPLLGEIRAAGR